MILVIREFFSGSLKSKSYLDNRNSWIDKLFLFLGTVVMIIKEDLLVTSITFSINPFCRKNVRVCQSQNFPLSCLSRPIGHWLAHAACREILGRAYMCDFSAEWNTADRD